MTVFPEEPKLSPLEKGKKTRTLLERHVTFVEVGLGFSLMAVLEPGFETDGASVPTMSELDDMDAADATKLRKKVKEEYPLIMSRFDFQSLLEVLVGSPWDMPRLLAAMVHDALYGMKWSVRLLCDLVYYWILEAAGYDRRRADVEYAAIRLAGWRNWDAVTSEEVERTRRVARMETVRTGNIPRIIAELREDEENRQHGGNKP